MHRTYLFVCLIALWSVFSSCDFVLYMMDDQPQSDVLCGLHVQASWHKNLFNTTVIELRASNQNSFEVTDIQLEALVFDINNDLVDQVTYCAVDAIASFTTETFETFTSEEVSMIGRVDVRIIKANRVY